MPQASNQLRARMYQLFGDEVDDSGPMNFLRKAGYTLTRHWQWYKPGITRYEQMSKDELDCLHFLIDEWDMGGLIDPPTVVTK